MAKFRQYNIQLLPLDTRKTEEVGLLGYKRLFDLFKQETTRSYKAKKMAGQAKALVNDTFICPFVIHVEEKFAYGKFIKFHKAETVTEFYTNERLFEAQIGTTAVSNTHYFRFMFDYANHRFGIEENNGRLPSPDVMLETLEHFLRDLADKNFPLYTLTLNLISDERTLKEVLAEGNEYGPIHVKLSFPNSRKLTKTLQELKENSVHSIEANMAPARGARMSGLPDYFRDLISSVAEFGEAKIVFFRQVKEKAGLRFQRFFYSTSKHPRWFALRQKRDEAEFDFMKRSWMSMHARAERELE